MPHFELKLEEFRFPPQLENGQANFRFNVDLRFINDKDQYTTERAVMPSPDTFWECDKNKKNELNYVRAANDITEDGITYSQFDMKVLDEWDRLILLVNGKSLHSILFRVDDVDRKDIWDRVQNFGMKIFEVAIGKIKDTIPGNFPLSSPDSLGGIADDLQSFMIKKIAGGDKMLFRRSIKLDAPPPGGNWQDWKNCPNKVPQNFKIKGRGKKGKYLIVFSVTKI